MLEQNIMYSMLFHTCAIIVCGLGVFSLFFGWQARSTANRKKSHSFYHMKTFAWSVILLSLVLWSFISGPEFAVVYSTSATAIFAWLYCVFGTNNKANAPGLAGTSFSRNASTQKTPVPVVDWHARKNKIVVFLCATIGAACCCAVVSIVIVKLVPISYANSLVFSGFFFPLSWAMCAVWVCTARQIWQPAVSMLFVTVTGSFFLVAL